MFQTHTLKAEIRRTLRLAVPLIGAQLLQMGNALVDTLVAGRLGRESLAAGGIGASIWFFSALLCIGLLAGLSPILSELIGQRRRNFVGEVFRQGLWLGVMVGVAALILLSLINSNVHRFGLDPELVPLVKEYLGAAMWSLPAFGIVMACRNVYEATGVTKPVLIVTFLGLITNIFFNLGLGLGWFGMPQLGLRGIGWSTTAVNIVMAVLLLYFLRSARFSRYKLIGPVNMPQWSQQARILVLSVPIFFALLFEAGLFVATMVQMGILGTLEAGAHSIAIGATSFCYMLPLGLSFALTSRVGRAFGRQDIRAIKLRICTGIILTIAVSVLTSGLLFFFRHPIAALYTQDAELQIFAAWLILLAAVFQLSDAAQATLIGMLRGMQDTKTPMLINAFAYWAIAFGVGAYCAHVLEMGATGLWLGLIIGLTVSSLLLGWRLHNRVKLAFFIPVPPVLREG